MPHTKSIRPWVVICYSVHDKKVVSVADSRLEDSARYLLKQMAEDAAKKIEREFDCEVALDVSDSLDRAIVSWDEDKMLTFDIANAKESGIRLKRKNDPRQNNKNGKKKKKNGERFCKASIEDVFGLYEAYKDTNNPIQPFPYYSEDEKCYKIIDVDMSDDRYDNFFINGMSCVKCGILGRYFWLETAGYGKNSIYAKPHFNLYGIDKNGKERQLTKDHIVSRSKGGKDSLENYQCLCKKCNERKGSMDNEKFLNLC
jgi:hypothetical protein